jgi:hypothetical protein
MTWAGLLYHGGAWWVTSLRGSSEAAVLAALRELDPDSPDRNLRAIIWTDAREAAYQQRPPGALMTITLHEPPAAGG